VGKDCVGLEHVLSPGGEADIIVGEQLELVDELVRGHEDLFGSEKGGVLNCALIVFPVRIFQDKARIQ